MCDSLLHRRGSPQLTVQQSLRLKRGSHSMWEPQQERSVDELRIRRQVGSFCASTAALVSLTGGSCDMYAIASWILYTLFVCARGTPACRHSMDRAEPDGWKHLHTNSQDCHPHNTATSRHDCNVNSTSRSMNRRCEHPVGPQQVLGRVHNTHLWLSDHGSCHQPCTATE